MTDDRANRLRGKRNEISEKAKQAQTEETDEQDKPSDTSKPSKPQEPDETGDSAEPSVKDERVGTYMYLPESQKDQLKRRYNYLKADYEIEYNTDLEKNRHFYPLVTEYGLDALEEFDPSDVRKRLERHGWL